MPIANTMFNDERLKAFPLRSRQDKMSDFTTSIQHYTRNSIRTIRQEK